MWRSKKAINSFSKICNSPLKFIKVECRPQDRREYSCRHGASQQHELWALVAQSLRKRARGHDARQPTWLSTEGSGVPWLHVRLDDRPKYYHHAPYRDAR